MKTNQITIQVPEGTSVVKELDKDGNIFIRFPYSEPVRSKSWEEFCEKHPLATGEYYINANSGKIYGVFSSNGIGERTNWPVCLKTKEDAEGIHALIQLTRLHDEWVGDWKEHTGEVYYSICQLEGGLKVTRHRVTHSLLSFPTEERAQEFLSCFKDLIEKS